MNKSFVLSIALFIGGARSTIAQTCVEVLQDTTRCGGIFHTGRMQYLQNTLDGACKVWVRKTWSDDKANKGAMKYKYHMGPKERIQLGCNEGEYGHWGEKYEWTVVKCKPRR